MVLWMMDWNTMEAPPMAKAAINITSSMGTRSPMAKERYLGFTSTVK